MKRLALATLVLIVVADSAFAQSSVRPDGRPLAFTVAPGALEDDPRERQARLLRRMEEADVHFRHICRSCGVTLPDTAPGASFDPMRALERR